MSVPSRPSRALLALGLVGVSITAWSFAPGGGGSPHAARPAVSDAPLLPALDATAAPVTVGSGEDPSSIVVSWARPPVATTSASVEVLPAASPTGPPALTVPVDAAGDAVALPALPAGSYLATVVLSAATGVTELGPSAPFGVGATGGLAHPGAVEAAASAAASLPCEGASYGVGRVSVDGYAGYQGSYCLPPAFTTGTGAFCVDHGLDYPFGVAGYGWASSVVGGAAPLDNQYGRAADPGALGRLAWIVGTAGSTTDPARAVAIGIITHAVMGDYPGLSVADLDPVHLTVSGGDPAAISADVGALWASSAAAGGPYQVQIQPGTGPYSVGSSYQGRLVLTGAGGGGVAGVGITLAATTGATVTPSTGTTGADGSLAFTWTPTSAATSVSLNGSTIGPLPGPQLTLWRPATASVPVQRVVTAGPGVTPTATVAVPVTAPATLTLVKASSDPTWVPVGTGFSFDVAQPTGPAGAWQTVAQRQTAADASMAPVTGLAPGPYRVTETAHPPAFATGGPWTGAVASGQTATVTMTDQVTPVPVTVTKTGDDQAVLPVGAGVAFAVAFDADGSGRYATPAGTVTTGASGSTPAVALAPGHYRITETTPPAGYAPSAPVAVTVPVATSATPAPFVVDVADTAIPGGVAITKVDSSTGTPLAGATMTVGPAAGSGPVATATSSASGPVTVDHLRPGAYTVTETRAPAGYLASSPASQTVQVGPGQVVAVTVRDSPAPVAAPAPAAPAAPAAAALPSPAGTGVLAFTGMPVWQSAAVGVAAVLAGALLVVSARARRRR